MNPDQPAQRASSANTGRWLWMLGVAAIVFAARLREILLHGGDVPYFDQWRIEAQQILLPWLQGDLSVTSFFLPHNEHVPAWTRLMAWLEAACLGRWDPQLQATLNAVLYAGFSGIVADWLSRHLPLAAAFLLSALVVALGALPFGWENSTWGFQSHVPLALGFVFLHLAGSFNRPPFSASWLFAQAAGVAALFTLGSMWAAPAAVCATILWTNSRDWRRWLVPGAIAAAGLVMLLVVRAHQPVNDTLPLAAKSLPQFLAALMLQLGWPSDWTGAFALLHLPALLLALQLRRQAKAEPIDSITLALALTAFAQAVAFAFARGGYLGFVSRYGDLLSLGVIANGVALWRLSTMNRRWRWMALALALGWCVAVAQGLNWISTRTHTEFFHSHSAEWSGLRHDAVHQYLATKDSRALNSEAVRNVLYPDPAAVMAVLDQPGLSALLPIQLRADKQPVRGDSVSAAAAWLRSQWTVIALGGGVLLLAGVVLTMRTSISATQPLLATTDPLRAPLLAALAIGAGGLIFLWPQPLEFSAEKRLSALLAPPGTVADLSFHITTETNYPKDNLTGGAYLWPENFRNSFFGTHIDGPGFTGTAQSSLFPIRSPWLVIPFAGFPASPDNAVRLRVEDAQGNALAEFACPGPNPKSLDVGFWAVDVRAYAGKSVRLIFVDGRTDAEGWVAAAAPQPADRAEIAAVRARSWAFEGTRSGHDSLAIVAGVALILALLAALDFRRNSA